MFTFSIDVAERDRAGDEFGEEPPHYYVRLYISGQWYLECEAGPFDKREESEAFARSFFEDVVGDGVDLMLLNACEKRGVKFSRTNRVR